MRTHVASLLHDDHMATLALIGRLEALLGRHGPASAPDASSVPVATLLRDVEQAVAREIRPHFAFEEAELFPRLAEAGLDELVELLVAEHAALLPLADRAVELAGRGRGRGAGFTPVVWVEFHTVAATLAGQLAAHVEKEEMGLLPALDDLLDAETDTALALAALR